MLIVIHDFAKFGYTKSPSIMNIFNNPSRIAENYGLKTAAALIVYFMLMKFAGLSHQIELRFLNLVILTVGVYYALRQFRKTHDQHMNYFRGLITGVATSGFAMLLFGLFLFAYMQIDTSLMESIRENDPMGRFLNPYIASFIVVLEGFFAGFLITFVLLNWVTTDEVNVPQG
jgi:hypothetical protein